MRYIPEPTPHVPEGDDPADELRAELRSAREMLALVEGLDTMRGPARMPTEMVVLPRHRGLSERQLSDLIARLERDLADVVDGVDRNRFCEVDEEGDE